VPSYETTSFKRLELVDKFQNGGDGGIAASNAGLGQPSVTTLSVTESGSDHVEEVLHQVFAVDEAALLEENHLLEFGLASEELFRLLAALAVSNQNLSGFSSCDDRIFLGEGDQLLHDAAQFLGTTKSRVDVPVADELPCEVREESPALIAWQS
jgi:hypothetical protein